MQNIVIEFWFPFLTLIFLVVIISYLREISGDLEIIAENTRKKEKIELRDFP